MTAGVLSFGMGVAIAGGPMDDHGKMHEKAWEKLDADGDGAISRQEFIDRAGKRFAALDEDGDGEVTKAEWKSKLGEMKEKMRERRQMHKQGRESRGHKEGR